jgi:DNA mismatch endonuclease (patch repair protein)
MRSNKGRDTRPELALRQAVYALGLRYRVSMRPVRTIRRTADIVFTRAKLAVFLDGCFWHGCPDHHTISRTNAEYWAGKVESNMRRDRETNDLLREAGWTVLRIWEHESAEKSAEKIARAYRTATYENRQSKYFL